MKIKEFLTETSRVCYEGAESCQRYIMCLYDRGVSWGSMPIVVYRCRETLFNYSRECSYLYDVVLDNATNEAFNDYSVLFKEHMTRDLEYIDAVLVELLSIQNRQDVSVFVTEMLQVQDDIFKLKKVLENVEEERKDDK